MADALAIRLMPNSQELLELYQAGHSEAATVLFDRYVQRLIALAGSRIGGQLKHRLDPEDVVQSAYCSFFAHAQSGEYEVAKAGDLWRLLSAITLNKLHGQIERQTAAKRDVRRDVPGDDVLGNAATTEPTAAEVVALIEQLHLIMRGLSADERRVLTSSLQGQNIDEIAVAIGKSPRTIRRLLASARSEMENRLLAADAEKDPSATARNLFIEAHAPLRFSDYVLEQLLGTGGMGKVYRARKKVSGKKVALKALHKSRQSDERSVRQFVHEADVLAKLRHPNIVGVRGLGRFPAGGFFIVMDFIDGTDLQARLSREPLPPTDVLRIVKQVGSAVRYAHEHGIVHCDLKPGNILMDGSGKVLVTDFGFAYMLTRGSVASHSAIGGTDGYIAPEVLKGQAPTPAADIYGLGALTWALCAGRPPEIGVPLKNQTVLLAVQAICARSLASEPEKRFHSVAEFIHELDNIATDLSADD
jgi:RNA polymerase sigma factor (sigma-70 family)